MRHSNISIETGNNQVVFRYGTPKSSFFETEDMVLDCETSYRSVIDYLKKYGEAGIDIIVNGENRGWFKYSTMCGTENGYQCGLVILFDKDYIYKPSGSSRFCEKARNVMAADLRDVVNEIVNDVDWWDLCDESEAIGDAMNVLDDVVDKANTEIEKAEDEIDYQIKHTSTPDYDRVLEAATNAYNALVGVKNAANDFIDGLSKKLNCSFVMGDAYSDGPYVLDAEVGPDMDVEDIFMDWLWNVIDTADKENYIDTLFNYIAA